MSVRDKMRANANQIRRIKGGSGTLSLDDMANALGSIGLQEAQTITPALYGKQILDGKYLSGVQTIEPVTKTLLAQLDSDFRAENIKSGVDILGLVGTFSGGGGGGGEPTIESGVIFIDYDGKLIAEWATADVAGKAALPANPNHSSDIKWGGHTIALTSQGWNWTLANIKTWVAAHPGETLVVGHNYRTTDGKLHICVRLTAELHKPATRFTCSKTTTINWGDGTAATTATSNADNVHDYASGGDYDIAIAIASGGTLKIPGTSNYSYLLHKPSDTSALENQPYNGCIWHVFLPISVTAIGSYAFNNCKKMASVSIPTGATDIDSYAFQNCYTLRSVSIPHGVTQIESNTFAYCNSLSNISIPYSVTGIGNYAFSNCIALTNISIPGGVTGIGTYAFYTCKMLPRLSIPDGVTSIKSYAFRDCNLLESVSIPDGVTSIESYAFNGCNMLSFIRFAPAVPPTVANTNAFSSISTNCVIYVPAASLAAYKAATNYPSPTEYTYQGY